MIYLGENRIRLPYGTYPLDRFPIDTIELLHRWSISDGGIFLQERSLIFCAYASNSNGITNF